MSILVTQPSQAMPCRFVMYVDGSLAGQIPIPGAGTAGIQMDGGAPIDFGDADVFLCARADENASRLFSGELSQLAFWNTPLTLAEVSMPTQPAECEYMQHLRNAGELWLVQGP